MSLIKRFEDLQAWQEGRKLTLEIYRLTAKGPMSKDYGLRNQIRRASVSAMSNVAEGFDCESRIEFARFLGIARRSAVEVQSLLYVALDAGYITQEKFRAWYEQAAQDQRSYRRTQTLSRQTRISHNTWHVTRRTWDVPA
jgi:four helix bundle protein